MWPNVYVIDLFSIQAVGGALRCIGSVSPTTLSIKLFEQHFVLQTFVEYSLGVCFANPAAWPSGNFFVVYRTSASMSKTV